ncbi:hypothetical protein TD95_005189 [Thielaviopsis punctulata]|uniref:Serum paraoxonase/arylesterase family protein n=1 Tax=Thielaviopsis punctulata TaxID=72032 RepID=A0A0F4ZIU5_9PEZI|nr:hypothetical protein TD95_005189 [Thielaviopsis punctulata]
MALLKKPYLAIVWALIALILGIKVKPTVDRVLEVLGIGRLITPTVVSPAGDLKYIPDTIQCEDLHLYEKTGMIFTACQDGREGRLSWFPPIDNFDDPFLAQESQGSIHIIDPKTFTSTRLEMENFNGPFITHGIDVIEDPKNPHAVYIFAVNHKPNLEFLDALYSSKSTVDVDKARSSIELFHHVLNTKTVRHLRTIHHPLITTPNDIFARSPTSFFVTNDHLYREGHLYRFYEQINPNSRGTNIIHVMLTSDDITAGVEATIALDRMHNLNGLGHGRTEDEILIGHCTGGETHIAQISANNQIRVLESVRVPMVMDNPTFFRDPYGSRSGILMPGLARGIELAGSQRNPDHKLASLVYFAMPSSNSSLVADGKKSKWEVKKLFEDDGERLSTVSGAVMVPIEPTKKEGEKRKAWLFASGFLSHAVVAVKIEI